MCQEGNMLFLKILKLLAPYVWAHRLVLQNGFINRDNKEQIIENVVAKTTVPTEDWTK